MIALVNSRLGGSVTLNPSPAAATLADDSLTGVVVPLSLRYRPLAVHLPPTMSTAARTMTQRVADYLRTLGASDQPVCLLDLGSHGEFLRRNLESGLPGYRFAYYNYFYPDIRGNGAEENFTDQRYRCVVALSHPAHYHLIARYVRRRFAGPPAVVLPFAQGASNASGLTVSYGPQAPLIVLQYPGAGSKRLLPVWKAFMQAYQRTRIDFTESFFNCRFIESIDPQRQLVDGPHFGAHLLSFEEFERYYAGVFATLDYFQWTEFHHPVTTAFLGSLRDCRIIYLHRDPRDIVTSVYHRYTYDALPEDFARYQSLDKEEALLRLLDGFDYIHCRRSCVDQIPSIEFMARNFAEIKSFPNIYPLKYEDIRYRPHEAYADLFRWLGLDTIGFVPSPSDVIAAHVPKGTFQHASEGKMKEGQENARIYRPLGLMVTHNLRKGVSGDWKNHFTPAVKKKVKDVAGEALIALGYEEGLDW